MNTDTNTRTHTAPELAELPACDVLAVDGSGGPEEPAFTGAIGALLTARARLGAPADVPLQGTYSQDDDPLHFDPADPQGWVWQLAVPAPPGATAEAVAGAGVDGRIHLVRLPAHRVARLVHHGPYADEQPSLDALYGFVTASGLTPVGPHTEVYVTDPATTPPAQLRTVLQVPVS